MFLPGIREKVCQEINVAAVGSSDIPEEGDRDLNLQDAVNFASAATGTLHFCNDNAISCSEMEMCIHQTGGIFGWADGQGYIYFKVLMPR